VSGNYSNGQEGSFSKDMIPGAAQAGTRHVNTKEEDVVTAEGVEPGVGAN
jgi:hypothetical protein